MHKLMTEERLQYFLNNKDIRDQDYSELVEHYFKANKSDWFQQERNGNIWNKKKLSEFWKLIRMHVMTRGEKHKYFAFKGFIFPEFDSSHSGVIESMDFWEYHEKEKRFNHQVDFQNSVFMGFANLNATIYDAVVNFNNCRFEDEVHLSYAVFNKEVNFGLVKFSKDVKLADINFAKDVRFDKTIFGGNVNLSNTLFYGESCFKQAEFIKELLCRRTRFIENVSFVGSVFKDEVNFFNSNFLKGANFFVIRSLANFNLHDIKFKGVADFMGANFTGKVKFINIEFENRFIFSDAQFSDGIFEHFISEDKQLAFYNVNFPKTFSFRLMDFSNTIFLKSNIAEVQFKECKWIEDGRIILKDERQSSDKTLDYYSSLEELYRQLKKNFDSNKDWELSGKAYVSEMEMRKKRLWKQKDRYHWFIYWFYDKTSGYTQNLKRPIISLLRLMAVSSIIYYFIDYSLLWAIQRGIYGALPKLITIDIPEELQFSGYWLIAANIETLLGSTFIVFFILALRKRFKQ